MQIAIYPLITLIALLYSAVGHGGASGYLAIMSMFEIEPNMMASTALILNCITAGISCTLFTRSGYLSLPLTLPFIAVSVPCAFLGAYARLSPQTYEMLLGGTLFFVALRLAFYKSPSEQNEQFAKRPPILIAALAGAILGFLAGAVGIGGGIFLSPLMILAGWADPKTTSATSALFIVVNSIAGLAGKAATGTICLSGLLPFLACAAIGAALGSFFGARISSGAGLRRLLAFVLLIAVTKMAVH